MNCNGWGCLSGGIGSKHQNEGAFYLVCRHRRLHRVQAAQIVPWLALPVSKVQTGPLPVLSVDKSVYL